LPKASQGQAIQIVESRCLMRLEVKSGLCCTPAEARKFL
jgi:hypothetical protein